MVMIGYAFCGSFCTLEQSCKQLEALHALGYDIQPIMSETVFSTDTRFGRADALMDKAEEICGRRGVATIVDAEPLGPASPMDAMIIAPCTGNTLAKLANGITDTPVTMAAKAHLRNGRPLVIALSTNDGLSGSAENIAKLLNRKNVYFVPFGQDDPEKKPSSMVADFTLIPQTVAAACSGKQLQPILL